ncbi:MAG: hypothetical protein V9G04_10005 [Nocardioides sp.]
MRDAAPIATLIEQARALATEGRAIDERLFALLAPLAAVEADPEGVEG